MEVFGYPDVITWKKFCFNTLFVDVIVCKKGQIIKQGTMKIDI